MYQIRWTILWMGVALAVIAVPKIVSSPYYLDVLIKILLWGGLASAYNISGGYGGQFSLGHAAFLGLGAYASTILFTRFEISPWLGVLAGMLVASALALALGWVCLRLRGPFLGLASLAFMQVTFIAATNLRSLTNGSEGIVIPFRPAFANMIFADKGSYFYLFLAYCAGTIFVTKLISQSRLGYYLIACREDQDAAAALGVNTTAIKISGLVISAALTAIGGTLYAQYVLYIDPHSLISFAVSIQFPLIAVVGGLGTVYGPLVGAFLMIPLSEILRSNLSGLISGLDLAMYGILLTVVVLFLPEGVLVEVRRQLRKARARIGGTDVANLESL